MNKQVNQDQKLDFLLDSHQVDQSAERLSRLEQQIMADIGIESADMSASLLPDSWIQTAQAFGLGAVIAAFVLVLATVPGTAQDPRDMYSLYMSGSYSYSGG